MAHRRAFVQDILIVALVCQTHILFADLHAVYDSALAAHCPDNGFMAVRAPVGAAVPTHIYSQVFTASTGIGTRVIYGALLAASR